jgi:hypothetical protein
MSFSRFLRERFATGSNLILAPDTLPDNGVRLLQNSRLTRILGVISSRAGMTTVGSAAGSPVRALWSLFGATTTTRYAQGATTLARLSSTWGSATTLATLTGTQPISAANFVDGEGNLHAYFTNSTGLGQYKDDGTTWRAWGIAPPAAAPLATALATDLSTSIDTMDSSATWTVASGLSAGPTDEANIKQEGTASQTITIAASGLGLIARSLGGTVNLDTLSGGDATVKDDDYIHLWVRADRPERIQSIVLDFDLDTTTVANAFRTNYYSMRLPGSVWLNQGANQWSKVQAPKSSFQRFGPDTALSWATVKCVRLSFQITSDGSCQIYLDDLKLRGGTDIVGSVRYTACYRCSTTGARGNPPRDANDQPVYTTALTVDRQRVNVTLSNIVQGGAAHPGDTQIDQLRLYRSINEAPAVQIDQIVDTASSPYVDEVSVASMLLTQTLEADNDRPPNAHVVFGPGALARLFLLAGQNDLYFSKAWEVHENRAENWPSTFRAKVGDGSEQALAGLVSDTTVLVWSDHRGYLVQGAGADTFLPVAIPNSRGIVSRYAIAEGDGRIFLVSQDGIYQQAGLSQTCLTPGIAPFFAGLPVAGQDGWNTDPEALATVRLSWQADALGPFVLMLYPSAGSTTPTREVYLGKNPLTGQYTDVSFDRRGGALMLHSLWRDPEANALYGGDLNGHIHRLEDVTTETDAGHALPWRVVTRSEHHGVPHQDKYYSQVLIEADTQGQLLTVQALYDKQTLAEVLSTTATTSTATGTMAFPVADPAAMRQDLALDLSGMLSSRVDVYRYGAYFEPQPEAVTFWDSGVLAFGRQTVVQGLWWTLMVGATVTVTVTIGERPADTYQLTPALGLRVPDRLFFPPGATGRQMRVTLASVEPFRVYDLRVRWKPYGAAQGYQELSVVAQAA